MEDTKIVQLHEIARNVQIKVENNSFEMYYSCITNAEVSANYEKGLSNEQQNRYGTKVHPGTSQRPGCSSGTGSRRCIFPEDSGRWHRNHSHRRQTLRTCEWRNRQRSRNPPCLWFHFRGRSGDPGPCWPGQRCIEGRGLHASCQGRRQSQSRPAGGRN